MSLTTLITGALFAASLLAQVPSGADPVIKDGQTVWFASSETRNQLVAKLGPPRLVAEFGDFVSLQYQFGVADPHEFSHILVFRKAGGTLVSITRNYEPDRLVDEFFPEKETSVHHYNEGSSRFGIRIRRLSGGMLLMAIGSPRAGAPCGQIAMMRESELGFFYPWLKLQPQP